MNRESLFILPENSPSTFAQDESLKKLPLPKLEESLERYYKNLLPFGNENELKNSRKVIDEFKNGVGKNLQQMLEEKAKKEKNWVTKFWEDYAYLEYRLPLAPYCIMIQPILINAVGIEESRENRLKAISRVIYYCCEYWTLVRDERVRPALSGDGKSAFSSNQIKRIFNTSRTPGEVKDEIVSYFKTKAEGECSSNVVVFGNGRIFYFDVMHNGKLISPQEFLHVLTIIRDKIENEKNQKGRIPVLTCDDRTNWHKNRNYIRELSKKNSENIEIIESSILVVTFDDNEPRDVSELCQQSLNGDMHSRWLDKSSQMISFKNGMIGFTGEHSCYDGMMSYSPFILISLMEQIEPDWNEKVEIKIQPVEMTFNYDDYLSNEIVRMEKFTTEIKSYLIARFDEFMDFGKISMKKQKIHPDCFVQMALQLAYYNLHKKLAPTYETATMREFYHGRTETVRSCSIEVKDWIDKMQDKNSTSTERLKYFREAANSQFRLMNEARKGNGFDRHFFGLWCIARENNIPIPSFYDDPLYAKSGGGGNFVLSTSTLGYFINLGVTAPMLKDGYGAFYTMLDDRIWILTSAFRDSEVTSCKKFYDSFASSMNEIKKLNESTSDAKL